MQPGQTMNDSAGFPLDVAARRGAASTSRARGAHGWVVGLTAALVALLLGLVTLTMIGYSTGLVPFLAGLVVAALPVPVYCVLALWVDRFEPEPRWLLAVAFFWGASVSVGVAIVVNTLGFELVREAFGAEAADLYGLSVSAPLVEEGSKAAALFLLFFWRPDEFDGVVDGIVYASMVGLGFAMTENVKYYAEAAAEGRAFGTFVVRGMFSPYAHPLFTSMTGIGLGLASQARGRAFRLAMPAVGFALAVVLHSVWNTSLFLSGRLGRGWVALLMYFVVMVPVFAGVLLVALFALRREGGILREHLRAEVERGLLPRAEYERLCTVRGRFAASASALFGRGFAAWRAQARLQSVASELAFHRHRVARGLAARDASAFEREGAYLRALRELGAGPR